MLKKIKSLFIVEDESATPKAKNETAAPQVKSRASNSVSNNSTPAPTSGGKATKQFTDVLVKALEENNLDGFDYMEYKRSLESLKKMTMDEATRYQSAFAMAQTMGVSAPKLIQSTQHYIKVLSNEQQKFQQAVANQQSSQIKNKQEEIKNLEATVKNKQQQIKKLTQEIAAHEKQAEKMKSEISGATAKVQSTRNNFQASFQLLSSQIQTDFENMKKYLK